MLKKFSIRLLLCTCIWGLAAHQLFAADLKSQTEKESYSIGYQVGLSMNQDGVKVDLDTFLKGLKDAVEGKEGALSDQEMKGLIANLRKKAHDIQMQKRQEQLDANAEESRAFLENNKTKKGVLTTESGLQYKILKEGDGPVPAPEDFVTVNYRGMFLDGEEFDSSYARGTPAKFQTSGVIKGWTQALQMMKVGSKWQLFIPPDLAYGTRGAGEKIPPNKLLVFEVELVGIEKGDKDGSSSDEVNFKAQAMNRINLTGKIDKSPRGYIIKTGENNAPAEVYTILNPKPEILDKLIKSEKAVQFEVVIVSGDNINIVKIDGKTYL